jgi:hypothetical protein
MEPANKDKFTVRMGVQAGDVPSWEAMQPHFGPLRKLLNESCRGPYSPEVDEFYLALRIDGDIDHWEKEGCDHMRRSRKERYISIDIYVPRTRWEGGIGIEIRRYLASCVESAFQQMIGKIQRDKTPIDGDALLRDWSAVKERYLSQDEAVATY